jgi:hypothetical protein
VAAYINFFLSYVNEEIGPVSSPRQPIRPDEAKQAWLDAME